MKIIWIIYRDFIKKGRNSKYENYGEKDDEFLQYMDDVKNQTI